MNENFLSTLDIYLNFRLKDFVLFVQCVLVFERNIFSLDSGDESNRREVQMVVAALILVLYEFYFY